MKQAQKHEDVAWKGCPSICEDSLDYGRTRMEGKAAR